MNTVISLVDDNTVKYLCDEGVKNILKGESMLMQFEILDSITESMAVINYSGEIIFTNKAWRSFSDENMGEDSYTGPNNNYLTTCDAVVGQELKMAQDAKFGIQQVMDKKLNIFELEYPCHSPSENRWFILRASQVLANPQLTLLAHINITNRKMAELKIEISYKKSLIINERLHTTLYKIVHDIQNPLSAIIGLIDLSKSESDSNVINEYLELIEEGSTNLSDFVKGTLNHISTTEETQCINVHDKINKYLESVEHLFKVNNIALKLDIQQKDAFHTNAIEFQSILSNLISNSIKYSDELKNDKFIHLRFSSDSKKGILTVEDNGIGIKKEDIPKLVEFNYQVKKTTSDGVGLGLFMVNKSVDILGGTFEISSEFGIGSKFVVEIPNRL